MLRLPKLLRLPQGTRKMNEPVQLTYAQKKYLFAIYKLGQNGGVVKSSEVAKIVGVSKASTAIMTEKLAESGFIEKEHYGRIELTESGIKAANPIFTNCIIIRDFLKKHPRSGRKHRRRGRSADLRPRFGKDREPAFGIHSWEMR